MTRIITGLFDNRRDAERAVQRLIQEFKINPKGVQVHATGSAKLGRLLSPEDHPAYGEGLRRGGIVVSAEVEEEDRLGQAMVAMKECGAVSSQLSHAQPRGSGAKGEPPNPR